MKQPTEFGKPLIIFLFLSFFLFLQTQVGGAEKPRELPVKLSEEFAIGDEEDDDHFIQDATEAYIVEDNIYLLDAKACCINKYDNRGKFLQSFGRVGHGPAELYNPSGFTICNKKIYISNTGNSRIEIFDLEGNHVGSFKLTQEPKKICADSRGNLLINFNWKNNMVHRFTTEGKRLDSFVPVSTNKDMMLRMFYDMISMTISPKGELFIVYLFRNKIDKFDKNGRLEFSVKRPIGFEHKALRPKKNSDGVHTLFGVPLNGAVVYSNDILYVMRIPGPDKKLKVQCDILNGNGKYLGTFRLPHAAAFLLPTENNNCLYIGDYENSTVHKYTISGIPR